jgi:adenylate cyclase
MKSKLVRGLVIGAAVFVLAGILHLVHFFDVWEWKTWDLRLRLFSSPTKASDDIVIFLVDQDSLDVYEQQGVPWPWPRAMYSYILEYCRQGGAKAVFLDFVFSEDSFYGVEDDRALADSMAASGNVFIPVSLSKTEKDIEETSLPLLKEFFLSPTPALSEAALPMKSVSLPVESILRSARGVGNSTFVQDRDGIFRRLPLVFSLDDSLLPSIPLALAEFLDRDLSPDDIPLESSSQMIIRYYGKKGTYDSYSIAAIINSFAQMQEGNQPQIPPEEFRGKTIFIGGSAPGLLDLRPTPFSPVCPGVEILATALDNLVHKDFVRTTALPTLLLFLASLSFITSVGTSLLKKIWMIVPFGVFCLGLTAGSACLAFVSGYWLEFVAPVFVVAMAFTSSMVLNYSIEGRQKRFIKNAFRHYLSPDVIERVLENPSLLRLGGEKRMISSFFSDVAGFTSISEGLTPEGLVNLLNDFLSEMTEIILSTGGTLDKYEGDAIISFWNAPLDQPDHAVRACRAALECQKRLAELRPVFLKNYGHELFMRIGVNSGPAVVGNMGSHSRFDYTAMGDTINLASRLEGACKQYGIPILVGESTYRMAKDIILAREVDLIRVVGKTKPERVYQVMGEKSQVQPETLERVENFHRALELYRKRDWEKALGLFEKDKDDRLAGVYILRIQNFRREPPPEEWAGVYELKTK